MSFSIFISRTHWAQFNLSWLDEGHNLWGWVTVLGYKILLSLIGGCRVPHPLPQPRRLQYYWVGSPALSRPHATAPMLISTPAFWVVSVAFSWNYFWSPGCVRDPDYVRPSNHGFCSSPPHELTVVYKHWINGSNGLGADIPYGLGTEAMNSHCLGSALDPLFFTC